jgi:hypothetical protein
MSRKEEAKAKDAIVTVNIDDFTRTRDSVSSMKFSCSTWAREAVNKTLLDRRQSQPFFPLPLSSRILSFLPFGF